MLYNICNICMHFLVHSRVHMIYTVNTILYCYKTSEFSFTKKRGWLINRVPWKIIFVSYDVHYKLLNYLKRNNKDKEVKALLSPEFSTMFT